MLRTSRPGRAASAVMIAVATTFAALTLVSAPAMADRKCEYVNFVLTCTETSTEGTDGTSGNTGGNGGSEPTCDLRPIDSGYDNPTAPFCDGKDVCFTVDHFAPLVLPEGDKPNEDSKARVTLCYVGNVGPPSPRRIFWSDDEEPPSLIEQARSAVDALEFTTPTVGVSPAGRTLVNLDTWFWLDGAQTEVTATAFTVTARATIRSMTVDPGDGSGSFACDNIATSAAEAEKSCVHAYQRSSARGSATVDGRPAFRATVTTVYDLSFTNGGAPITIPGAPTTVDGPPASTTLRVDEVQTLSRPNR